MRATIEFSLPEEQEEHNDAIHGSDYKAALWDLDQTLRGWLKYGHQFKTVDEALESARQRLFDVVADNGITLD